MTAPARPSMSRARRALRRMLVEPFDRQLERELEREVVGSCESLLDLGCGFDSPVGAFSCKLTRCVGVDIFEPYLQRSVEAGIHSEYRCTDVLSIADELESGSFDCVIALDLIEHLRREDGIRLIAGMERVASRKVIIFTPNGFVPQAPYDGNAFQEHRSGWEPDEMRRLGYRVTGIYGWKPLRGERAEPVVRPRGLGSLLAMWSQPLVRARPEHAFHLLCVKDVAADAAPDPTFAPSRPWGRANTRPS